ncbi:hypothetical protein LCGC14_0552720 [marine sediment metagenome]|uniref:Uncharacterized protein n=1 Tax=marine sediment metagenome TaxID=412755 RepID=A0A0F9RPC5_9ZZZZ
MGGQRDDGKGGTDSEDLGLTTQGPTLLVTDMAVWRPHPGATRVAIAASCDWDVRYADDCSETPPPTPAKLATLRDIRRRTADAPRRSAA